MPHVILSFVAALFASASAYFLTGSLLGAFAAYILGGFLYLCTVVLVAVLSKQDRDAGTKKAELETSTTQVRNASATPFG